MIRWKIAARCVLIAVVGLCSTAAFTHEGHAQPIPRAPAAPGTPPRISIALIDLPLVEALETLSREARLNLVWQAATLGDRARMRISCRLERALPEEALACVTKAAGVDYVRLSSGTYVVIAGAEQPLALASLGGRVLDASNGAPLPQARVQLAEVPESVLSSDDGGFSFPRLRPGAYSLVVRAVGYQPHREVIELPPSGSALLRLPLVRTERAVRPIIVNGLRAGALSATLGGATLGDSVVRRTLTGPALFLPGAAVPLGVSRRDGTGDLHLQGGDLGEHPWRIDGIPLYDVSSLSGLLGIVSPTAIEALHVQRSGYRASAGSYATGVIDLRHAMGRDEANPSAEVSIDPMAVAGRLATPLSVGSARGQAMLAGRTGLWPWTAPAALARAMRHWSVPDPVLLARLTEFGAVPGMEGLEAASFRTGIADENLQVHDLHAAARLQLGIGHTISASTLLTQQRVSYRGAAHDGGVSIMQTADRYDKHTFGAQLTHEWLIGTRVRQQLQARVSRHALQHGGVMSMNTAPLDPVRASEDNAMTELALQGEWRVQSGARTELLLATEVAHNRAHLDLANRVLRPLAYSSAVTRATLVADMTRQLRGGRFLDAGLRVTQLQNGRTFAEPRLAVRGELASGAQSLAWRVAAGGYHQFVNQFDVASTMPVAFVPSVRFWLPSDGTVPVAQSWHVAGEAAYTPAAGWELRGEVYARWHPALVMFDYGVMYGGSANASATVAATSFA